MGSLRSERRSPSPGRSTVRTLRRITCTTTTSASPTRSSVATTTRARRSRARSTSRGPFGPKSPNAILPLSSRAVVVNRAGRPDAAMNDVEQAMAIVRETGDNGAPYLPCLYEQRGRALLKRRDVAGAVAACAEGVKLQEEQGAIGPDKVYSDDALTCLGEAELAAGKIDAAIADLERSVTLTKRDWKAEVPIAKIDLAKALRARGGDLDRARRLAEEGTAELRGVTGAEERERGAEAGLGGFERGRGGGCSPGEE